MPGSARRTRRAYSLHLYILIILASVSIAGLAVAAESLCEPGFVHGPRANPSAVPVAASHPDTTPGVVTTQWLGHSRFLIITAGGIVALTDPHFRHALPTMPDIVTISNEHPTHNQSRIVPGNARVLRGRTPHDEWIEVSASVGDLTVKGLPSSDGNAIDIPVQNTIFVFRTEGLCILHLGNLRRPLNEAQRQRLGRPDVLMIPIDGQWTLSYEQVAETITQLQPAIVLPMHLRCSRACAALHGTYQGDGADTARAGDDAESHTSYPPRRQRGDGA